jgi:hypothetical protein
MQGLVQVLALIIVLAAGIWLIAVAGLMAMRPRYGLALMGRMLAHLEAGSWRLNVTEQGLRILAGVALIVRAPGAKLPALFEVAGWILVISSIVVIVAPVRWHAAYGSWWIRGLTPSTLRLLSPIPAAAGAGLIYAAL